MDPHRLARVAVGVLVLVLCGCGDDATGNGDAVPPTRASTPTEAINGMLTLAERGRWEAYVSTYYVERHKMDKPAEQTKKIADNLAKLGELLIEKLRGCLGQSPTMSEDGTKATYPNGLTLHEKDGQWGFHL